MKKRIDKKKEKVVDQYEGHIYNSRFIFLMPKVIARIRLFLQTKRKEREAREKLEKKANSLKRLDFAHKHTNNQISTRDSDMLKSSEPPASSKDEASEVDEAIGEGPHEGKQRKAPKFSTIAENRLEEESSSHAKSLSKSFTEDLESQRKNSVTAEHDDNRKSILSRIRTE